MWFSGPVVVIVIPKTCFFNRDGKGLSYSRWRSPRRLVLRWTLLSISEYAAIP